MTRTDAPADDRVGPPEDSPSVTTASTSPERTVFSESDNPDGWIATDLTVDLER